MLFSAGSACVVAFNFFQEINILQRILPLLLLTIYNSINFTINIISTTSAIFLLLLLLQLLLLLLRLLLRLLLLLLALVLVLLLVILVLVLLLLLLLLILLLLLLEVLLVRVGSARLRFARVPRVMRVCVSRGFRACCSTRVPRASSHSIFF